MLEMTDIGPGPVAVLVSGWVFIAIATVAVGARVYLRLKIQRQCFVASDFFMFTAWLSAVVATIFTVLLDRLGALDPMVDTSMESYHGDENHIHQVFKLFWYWNIPVWSTLTLNKLTLLTLYLQIFPDFMRKRRILLWLTIAYVTASFGASVALLFLICHPIRDSWDLDHAGHCPIVLTEIVFWVTWALQFAGDLLVFALPWLVIYRIKMRRSLKYGMYFTFLLGIVNITFSILRFATIQVADWRNSIPFSTVTLWTTLDCNVGLVIACLPSLRPYFNPTKLGNRFRKSSKESGGGSKAPLTIGSHPTRRPRTAGLDGGDRADGREMDESEVDLAEE
ncbi:hypothetical protein B0J13DRAFT_661488, partial [Dactylonectria estremocensis]